jgi:hypothetical protein
VGAQAEQQAGRVGAEQDDRDDERHRLDLVAEVDLLLPTDGRRPPSMSWKTAGSTSAAAASRSMSTWTLAAVRSKYCRSRLRPPTNIAAPMTSRMLPRIEPMIDALTTSCRPALSAKKAMTSSGKLPNVTFRKPPMPGARLRGELLGGAAHERRRRDDAERRRDEDRRRRRVHDELERDRHRDERDEHIRASRSR